MKLELATLEAALTNYKFQEGNSYLLIWVELTLSLGKTPIHTWRINATSAHNDDNIHKFVETGETQNEAIEDFVAARLREAWFGGSDQTVYDAP